MCRNITALRGLDPEATPEEIEAAALQYVRKVGGLTSISAATRLAVGAGTTAALRDGGAESRTAREFWPRTPDFAASADTVAIPPVGGLHLQYGAAAAREVVVSWHATAA